MPPWRDSKLKPARTTEPLKWTNYEPTKKKKIATVTQNEQCEFNSIGKVAQQGGADISKRGSRIAKCQINNTSDVFCEAGR